MQQNKTINILFGIIIILLLVIGINYFFVKKEAPSTESSKVITNLNTKVLKSVILDTDKEIYGTGENITALVLIKNEFDAEKSWEIVAGIKELSTSVNSPLILKQGKSIILSPGETSKQELNFGFEKNKLLPGEYKLELSILENNQEISLKATTFKIQ